MKQKSNANKQAEKVQSQRKHSRVAAILSRDLDYSTVFPSELSRIDKINMVRAGVRAIEGNTIWK